MAEIVKNMYILICAILIINIYLVKSNPIIVEFKSCGTDLARRVARVCDNLGGFNIFKREISRHSHHRVKRRIVDECCFKACSDGVIGEYCYVRESSRKM